MKVLTIIGARPQFIKAVVVSNEFKKSNIDEIILHTGQHFDNNMSDIFFEQLNLNKPHYNLNINSLSHGAMTGRMLEQIEEKIVFIKPDLVLVYGDTNSTLAGALAAKKQYVKVAHIEAGLRSFNMNMPEEINRILTDRISDFLFCPTEKAIINLKEEGFDSFKANIYLSGDVMKDSALYFSNFSKKPNFEIPQNYNLCTIHREENTNDTKKLEEILYALNIISKQNPVILPLHPRTKNIINNNLPKFKNIIFCEPLGYLEMIYLIKNSKIVFTDSGGLQKESYFFQKPSLILRNETEWIELVKAGYAKIVGSDKNTILDSFNFFMNNEVNFDKKLYGDGKASQFIVEQIINNLK